MTIKYFITKKLSRKASCNSYNVHKLYYKLIDEINSNGMLRLITVKMPTCYMYIPHSILKNPQSYKIFKNEYGSMRFCHKFSYSSLLLLLKRRDIHLVEDIPEYFIDKYKDDLDWDILSKTIKITDKNLTKYSGYLNWFCISSRYIHRSTAIKFQHQLIWSQIIKEGCFLYDHGSSTIEFSNNTFLDISPYLNNLEDLSKYDKNYRSESEYSDDD